MELTNEMEKEVKNQIFPTIIEMINPEVENCGITIDAYAEIIYSHIMALGYNKGDINSAVSDLMPFRNPIFYQSTEEEDAITMVNNFSMVMEDFRFQYRAFRVFYENFQNEMPFDKNLIEVQKVLFPLRMGHFF